MRGYRPQFDAWAVQLEASAEPISSEEVLGIRVDHDYFGVFNSNRQRIGLLGDTSAAVVKAYPFGNAFLEDVRDITEIRNRPTAGPMTVSRTQ